MVFVPIGDTPTAPLAADVQLYVTPAVELPKVTSVVFCPEHTACGAGVNVTFGAGLTVIVTVIGEPLQAFAVGVIVYIIVCTVELLLINVWLIALPVPAIAPDIFAFAPTVQLYVVPDTVAVNATFSAVPEHIVEVDGLALATVIGLTIILYVDTAPGHAAPPVVTADAK